MWNKGYFKKWNERELNFGPNPEYKDFYFELFKWITNKPQKFSDTQLKVLKTFEDNKFVMIKKARQAGETSLATLYLAVKAFLNPKMTIIIICDKGGETKHIIKNFRRIYTNLFVDEFDEPPTNNKSKIRLKNGSLIKASCNAADAFCSERADVIYFTEAAHQRGLEGDLHFAMEVIREKKGQIIISSTPNGYDRFQALWDGVNEWVKVKMNHFSNPLHNQVTYDNQIQYYGYNDAMVTQELDGDFSPPNTL